MSQTKIENTSGSIYIALTLRNPTKEDPEPYHWLLYLVDKEVNNGIKVHATNPSGAFVFEQKAWTAGTSISLIALLKIGHLGKHTVAEIVEALSKVPMHNTAEKDGFFNCRVWLGQALAELVKHGVIHCNNIPELEQEAISEANKVKEAVELGKSKAAIQISKFFK